MQGQFVIDPAMNTSRTGVVESRTRRGVALATLLMSLSLHGCTSVDHGAVELSWTLIDFNGQEQKSCTNIGVESIRVAWDVDGQQGFRDFACNAGHAVTEFEVPQGQSFLHVEPRCASGAAIKPEHVVAPAPIERTIIAGDVVELHAVVIEIDSEACPVTMSRRLQYPTQPRDTDLSWPSDLQGERR
jgi:hypothetical protein